MSKRFRWIIAGGVLAAVVLVLIIRFRDQPTHETPVAPVQPDSPEVAREPEPQAQQAESAAVPTAFGTISGRVVFAESGKAVAEKSIELNHNGRTVTAQSDAEGYFFVADIPAGTHGARMLDEALALLPDSAVFVVAEEPAHTEVTLLVVAGQRIAGRVYDRDTGAGIPNVKVDLQREDVRYGFKPQRTNDAGEYAFVQLVPGNYSVLRHPAPEYGGLQEESFEVRLPAGTNQESVDFGLSKGYRIAGRVYDEADNPIAGIEIYGINTTHQSGAKTAADGSFVLGGFSSNEEVTVVPGLHEQTVLEMDPPKGRVHIRDADVTGVRIVLGVAATIKGVVVDPNGAPKEGVRIQARGSESTSAYGNVSARSREDGTITLAGLTAGEYELVFNDLPGDRPDHLIQKVSLAKGEKLTGLQFAYPLSGGLTISGRVTNTRGAPIEKAAVFVQSEDTVFTDADGTYIVPDLSTGEYQLSAAHNQYTSAERVTVAAGTANVNFVLVDNAAIEGRLLSARTGQPITVFSMGTGVIHEPEGRFRVTVSEGESTVTFRAEGYVETQVKLPYVVAGETRRDVIVRLESGNTLAGRVVDSSRVGIDGVEIFRGEVPSPMMHQQSPLTTRADGSFSLDGVPAGPNRISARHPRFVASTVNVNVIPGATNRVEIVLSSGGGVEGRITLDREPVAGLQVFVTYGVEHKSTETDADGRYVLSGLVDGPAQVNASLQNGADYRRKSSQFIVTSGFTTEINFDFVSSTSVIEGIVYESPNTPIRQSAQLSAQVDTGGNVWESVSTETDAVGRFLLEGVPAGEVMLQMHSNGFPPKIERFTIGNGQRLRHDVLLYGGATIRAQVRADWRGQVYVVQGAVEIKSMTREMVFALERKLAGAALVVDGVAEIPGLEPGTYTVVAFIVDEANFREGDDPFDHMLVDSEVVTLSKDEVKSVQLNP